MKTISLSVCIITKNEGRFIEACLRSIHKIANEIILVDSGSADDTVVIAKRYNANVFFIDWRNDYAYARNVAISKCTGDWIFFLDADEYLIHPENLVSILKKTKKDNTGGYLIERTDIYRHKNSGLITHYPVGLVRLFRNGLSFFYEGSVHEQINKCITDKDYSIGIIKKAVIIHQVYLCDDEFLETKQLRYLSLINRALEQEEYNYWMQYQKAKTCWFLDRKEEAKKIFKQLAEDNACPLVIRCSGYCNNAVLLMEEGVLDEALLLVDKSLLLNPNQSMGFMIKGNILYNSDQFKKSIRAFRRVKTSINTLRYNQIIPGDLYIKPEEKKYKTACCYLAMGKELSAIFLLKKALKINDKYAPALLLLAKIYLAKNKKNEAVELLRTCLLVNSGWKNATDLFNTIYTDGNDLII